MSHYEMDKKLQFQTKVYASNLSMHKRITDAFFKDTPPLETVIHDAYLMPRLRLFSEGGSKLSPAGNPYASTQIY